jgi:hypothetical protein
MPAASDANRKPARSGVLKSDVMIFPRIWIESRARRQGEAKDGQAVLTIEQSTNWGNGSVGRRREALVIFIAYSCSGLPRP